MFVGVLPLITQTVEVSERAHQSPFCPTRASIAVWFATVPRKSAIARSGS